MSAMPMDATDTSLYFKTRLVQFGRPLHFLWRDTLLWFTPLQSTGTWYMVQSTGSWYMVHARINIQITLLLEGEHGISTADQFAFYWTQVNLGSDLWVWMSVSQYITLFRLN